MPLPQYGVGHLPPVYLAILSRLVLHADVDQLGLVLGPHFAHKVSQNCDLAGVALAFDDLPDAHTGQFGVLGEQGMNLWFVRIKDRATRLAVTCWSFVRLQSPSDRVSMDTQTLGDGPLGQFLHLVQPTDFRPLCHRDHLLSS